MPQAVMKATLPAFTTKSFSCLSSSEKPKSSAWDFEIDKTHRSRPISSLRSLGIFDGIQGSHPIIIFVQGRASAGSYHAQRQDSRKYSMCPSGHLPAGFGADAAIRR